MATTDDERIVVNVRCLPEEASPGRAHLTRFQRSTRPEVIGPTLRLTCKPSDTVAALKEMVQSASSYPPASCPSSPLRTPRFDSGASYESSLDRFALPSRASFAPRYSTAM